MADEPALSRALLQLDRRLTGIESFLGPLGAAAAAAAAAAPAAASPAASDSIARRTAPAAAAAPSPAGLPILVTMAASSAASALARIPCHPIDTIKAKLQVHGSQQLSQPAGRAARAWSPLAAAHTVLKTEGIKGFYRGIGCAKRPQFPVAPAFCSPSPRSPAFSSDFLMSLPVLPALALLLSASVCLPPDLRVSPSPSLLSCVCSLCLHVHRPIASSATDSSNLGITG